MLTRGFDRSNVFCSTYTSHGSILLNTGAALGQHIGSGWVRCKFVTTWTRGPRPATHQCSTHIAIQV